MNKYNRSSAGQFYPQKKAAEATASEGTRQNANVQGNGRVVAEKVCGNDRNLPKSGKSPVGRQA
ncbi:MAG: hypothetical protein HFI58_01740 [Lachnospiraceae bacterium]|jgi:hypothetical protein|nr:hypothetical protein [Lachnospiraceae bacterium]MCI9013673.1 hypothetical protein [Lachnospiraceae bacterium]MCI9253550.1 hypothetical protein [Lachnospiraceae bacterium]